MNVINAKTNERQQGSVDKNRNSLFASILKTVSALLGIMSLKTDLFTSVENVRPAVSTRVRLRLQTGSNFCFTTAHNRTISIGLQDRFSRFRIDQNVCANVQSCK